MVPSEKSKGDPGAERDLERPVQRAFGALADREAGKGLKRQERGQQAQWLAVDDGNAIEAEDLTVPGGRYAPRPPTTMGTGPVGTRYRIVNGRPVAY